jgi:hypothetical protein
LSSYAMVTPLTSVFIASNLLRNIGGGQGQGHRLSGLLCI